MEAWDHTAWLCAHIPRFDKKGAAKKLTDFHPLRGGGGAGDGTVSVSGIMSAAKQTGMPKTATEAERQAAFDRILKAKRNRK